MPSPHRAGIGTMMTFLWATLSLEGPPGVRGSHGPTLATQLATLSLWASSLTSWASVSTLVKEEHLWCQLPRIQ